MKAAKIKKQDIINKELEKNVDLISEIHTKTKIQYNISQKEEELEQRRRIEAKNLFSKKRNSNKIDIEGDEDLE